jgi:hypothetical protein
MSDFKFKPDKIRYLNNVETIDSLHKNKVDNFMQNKLNLEEYKKNQEILKKELNELNYNDCINKNINFLNKKTEYIKKIDELEQKINNIINYNDELQYYQQTEEILFNYFNITDNSNYNKNDIDDDYLPLEEDEKPKEKSLLERLNENSKKKRKEKKVTRKRIKDVNTLIKDNNMNNNIFKYINECESNNNLNRLYLYKNYKILLDGYKTQKNINKICLTCNIDKIHIFSEGIFTCPKCGESDDYIIENEANNYKDPIVEKPTFPYKRKNHFCEWLSQFQAKVSIDIPDDVIKTIENELIKMRISKNKIKDIKISKFKNILKILKLNSYYQHISYIKSKLTGIPPPSLTRDDETEFKKMFDLIQIPYAKFCPSTRINFLSYSYILNKFCCIKNLSQYKSYFPLLKNPQKLAFHDQIFEKICNYLNWPFYPSE